MVGFQVTRIKAPLKLKNVRKFRKVFRKIKLPNKTPMFLIAIAKISKPDVFW